MDYLIYYIGAINIIAFCMFGIDKYKAIHNKWRTSEKALFIVAIIGGVLGAMIGMHVFRHKTKHKQFTIGMPVILIVWLILIVYIETKLGL